jgi:hypothetical protein
MKQECSPVPVPHYLREQLISSDDFLPRLRERGWSVAAVRPVYTDPEVIRQPWLVCPTGTCYSERTFYHLFGMMRFRKLLRTALLRTPCPTSVFTYCRGRESPCPSRHGDEAPAFLSLNTRS